jgi:hypothetical protein
MFWFAGEGFARRLLTLRAFLAHPKGGAVLKGYCRAAAITDRRV